MRHRCRRSLTFVFGRDWFAIPVYVDDDIGGIHGNNNNVRDHILNNSLSGRVEMVVASPWRIVLEDFRSLKHDRSYLEADKQQAAVKRLQQQRRIQSSSWPSHDQISNECVYQ